MIKDIEYSLEYKSYLAEKEFYDSIYKVVTESQICTESYITEAEGKSIKDIIIQYSEKFVKNIQNAWDKFKQFMNERTWEQVKEKYGKLLQEDRSLTITEVGENDVLPIVDKLTTFLNEPNGKLTVEGLNEKYESPTDLLHKNYNYFKTVDEFSKSKLQEYIKNNCFEVPKVGEEIRLEKIQEFSKFLDEAPKMMDLIGKDLDSINEAIKVIKTAASAMTQTPVNNNNGETVEHNAYNACLDIVDSYLSPLLEAIKTVDAADPSGEHTNNTEGANQNKLIQKHIMDFYKIYSTVLTLKMNNLNKAKTVALKICLAYGRNAAKYNNETNVEQPTSTETTANAKDIVTK